MLVAQAEASSVRELGYKTPFPPASCPSDCQAIAQVTGFQVQIGTDRNPLRVNKPGKIVAWTVRLSKPNKDQLTYFRTTFGATPQARVSIVRSLKRRHLYRLVAQSQVFSLEKYFGGTPTFALRQPLPVKKDDIVAVTVPTWIPAFAHALSDDQAWRASHASTQCTSSTPPPADQETIGGTKTYGCFYRTARLLYSATFIPDNKQTNPPAK